MTSLRVGVVPRGLEEVLARAAGAAGDAAGAGGDATSAGGDAASAGGDAAGASDGSAASFLAPDVRAWLASPAQGLSSGIESAAGAEAATAALARLAPSNLEVAATVDSEAACWAELTRRRDGEAETCVLGLTYGPAGQVSRLVWLRVPLVPARALNPSEGARAARPILEGYFADLMASRFREAATHFAVDALYSHPPYGGGTERVLYDGREALWRGFETERGPSPVQQIITGLWQQRDRVFVEGVIEGIPNGGTFFATAQIGGGGEIARYVAFYSATRIPG
jgi:hypothetical protein